jgi:hypothetical protein
MPSSSSSFTPDLSAIQQRAAAYFAAFGSPLFAATLAQQPFLDVKFAENLALNVISDREILANASRQGDIGSTNRAQLPDAHSRKEHGSVDFDKSAATLLAIREVAAQYLAKHGIKFMVFASGKSAEEMLAILRGRIDRPTALEWAEARSVMFKIFLRRIGEVAIKFDGGVDHQHQEQNQHQQHQVVNVHDLMEALFKKHSVESAVVTATWGSAATHTPQEISWSTTTNNNNNTATSNENENDEAIENHWHFGSAGVFVALTLCLEYFSQNKIPLSSKVNQLLESVGSKSFRLEGEDADSVTVEDLLFSRNFSVSTTRRLLPLRSSTQFPPAGTPLTTKSHLLIGLIDKVQKSTSSGKANHNKNNFEAGLLILQYIIQSHAKQVNNKTRSGDEDEDENSCVCLNELTSDFFKKCGVSEFLFYPGTQHKQDDESVESLHFGLRGSESIAKGFHKMLLHIAAAFRNVQGSGGVSHETSRRLIFSLPMFSSDANNNNNNNNLFLLRSVSGNLFLTVIGEGQQDQDTKFFSMQCIGASADSGKGFVVSSKSEGFNAEFAALGCSQALAFQGFDFYGASTKSRQQQQQPSSSSRYTSDFLRFFSSTKNSSLKNENQQEGHQLAEEFSKTGFDEVAARFALLGYEQEFNASSLEFGANVANNNNHQNEQQYVWMCRRALNPASPKSILDGFFVKNIPQQHHFQEFKIDLHHPCSIHRIELDFSRFDFLNENEDESNAEVKVPDFVEVFGFLPDVAHSHPSSASSVEKIQLVPKTSVAHFGGSVKVFEISSSELNHIQIETILVKIYGEGSVGFNRIKCFSKRKFF